MQINTIELCKKIFHRYESQHTIEAYYGLLAYYALAQVAETVHDETLRAKCKEYLGQYPDKFPHPRYNFESYRVGGNGKAWMFFQQLAPEWEADLRKYADITMDAPVDDQGILCHPRSPEVYKIWIDVVTCTTPFMLFVGLALQEEKYIDFAVDQCIKMYDCFMDKTCGLLHQAKGFMENPKWVSADHWSRGNGWGYLGLAELLRYLPAESKHRAKVEEYFIDHTDALLAHQAKNGLWRQEIPEELSWYESSGTGLILYGLGIGLRKGVLQGDKYRGAFEKGIHALAKYCLTEDFATHYSCPGCLCPGEGAEKGTVKAYLTEKAPETDEVHSYGCMMLAFLEASKNGITNVEISNKIERRAWL